MVGFLGCERTLLAHVQLFTHQYPQVLLHKKILEVEVKASLYVWNIRIINESRIWPKNGNKEDEILAFQYYLKKPVRI